MTEAKQYSHFLWPLVLVVFGVYTADIVIHHGYTGFLGVAMEAGWGQQVFIDLCIALFIGLGFLIKDARQKGIAAWPFVIATVFLGSIGPLMYLSYRGLRGRPKGSPE